MALAITGTGNGSLNNLALSANTGTIVDTARAGGIVQVKFFNLADTGDDTTSTTFQDSTLTLSITPTSTTNKILIQWAAVLYSNDSNNGVKVGIKRTVGATNTLIDDTGLHMLKQFFNGSTNKHTLASDFYLDSPATTSSVTYTIQYASYTSGQSVQFGNNSASYKHILLQEVVA